jgi:hypothetical protein
MDKVHCIIGTSTGMSMENDNGRITESSVQIDAFAKLVQSVHTRFSGKKKKKDHDDNKYIGNSASPKNSNVELTNQMLQIHEKEECKDDSIDDSIDVHPDVHDVNLEITPSMDLDQSHNKNIEDNDEFWLVQSDDITDAPTTTTIDEEDVEIKMGSNRPINEIDFECSINEDNGKDDLYQDEKDQTLE